MRGYVRALASAVGVDPQPLIREYNRAHVDTGDPHVSHVTRVADPVPPAADPGATSVDIPAVDTAPDSSPDAAASSDEAASRDTAAADPDMTVSDLPAVSEDPTPTVDDLPVVAPPPPPHPNMPGTWVTESPGRPARPRHPSGPRHPRGPRHPHARRERRGSARVWVPAVLVLAVAGLATGLALSSQSGPSAKNSAAVSQPSKSASPATTAPKTAAPSTANTPSPAQAAPAPVRSLHVAGAEAFGPNGLADGDDSQGAMSVVRHSSQGPWQTQWYATAAFGNLKDGTGLLIDMGHQVTITSVRINMAGYRGANLQLRVGDSAGDPSSMRVAAHKSGVGGTVRVTLSSPQHVRYVLIWFTQLPPDGAGTYQATVYHVAVNGR